MKSLEYFQVSNIQVKKIIWLIYIYTKYKSNIW